MDEALLSFSSSDLETAIAVIAALTRATTAPSATT
jgi:hypothetical protein